MGYKAGHLDNTLLARLCSVCRFWSMIPFIALLSGILMLSGFSPNTGSSREMLPKASKKWIGTWATAPQLVEPRNMPPAPGLENNALRQIVCVSIGGKRIRIKFSNEFGTDPVEMESVQIAVSKGGNVIEESTSRELKFKGIPKVIMAPGSTVISDPVPFDLEPRMKVAITIQFGKISPDITGHPGSRTTSYLLAGNDTTPNTDFGKAVPTDHWYIINGIEVEARKSSAAIAILGNSITDGRGSGTNKQNRWPDILAMRLLKNKAAQNIGVLNMGIGGNCVLKGGLGPTALDRFQRDVLDNEGVRWLIIMEGINDLGTTKDSTEALEVVRNLKNAYKTMIDKAHSQDIKVYGGTITPIKKSFYYTDYREKARESINNWIRNSGQFDAVIDFDKAIRNPKDPSTILPKAQSGDYLHPNELGYRMMGEAVELSLFNLK